jgi:hypothetical protein
MGNTGVEQMVQTERFAQHDNFLADAELAAIQAFFQTQVQWTFGWQSNKNNANVPYSHWNHDFLQTDRANQTDCTDQLLSDAALTPLAALWTRLQTELLPGHALVRCYANAHTFGIEGYPHVDSRKPGNYTTIFYLNPQRKPEWAGETVFINDLGDIALGHRHRKPRQPSHPALGHDAHRDCPQAPDH